MRHSPLMARAATKTMQLQLRIKDEDSMVNGPPETGGAVLLVVPIYPFQFRKPHRSFLPTVLVVVRLVSGSDLALHRRMKGSELGRD
jgi:hypothetical protein